MKQMNIIVAEHFGMCFGVRDALKEVDRLAHAGPLTILGELVHNPVVRERLTARGVHEGQIREIGNAQTHQVMMTAHGASDSSRLAWEGAGFAVADGTCPLVRHAHKQLRSLVQLGYFPIVIGSKGHVEVEGLIGDFPDAVVVERAEEIAHLPKHETRFGIISQTTQPIEYVRRIVGALRRARPEAEVKFCDTVCQPTRNRQNALQRLLARCETIVVVGGRHSNNTRQLVETARAVGRHVIHIERPDELRAGWFDGADNVGLTAGTSTLKETVAAVQKRLEEIASQI